MGLMSSYCSHAKINLYLDVLQPRPDGYHNIETIFQSCLPFDNLDAQLLDSDEIIMECTGAVLGKPEENLAYRAAKLLKDTFGVKKGVHIKLTKNIPVGAGLGGGSGNAAVTLVECNELWELGLSLDDLCKLGVQLGADVPFFIRGGTAAATGIGDVLFPMPSLYDVLKANKLPPVELVLIHPDISVSTPWVYRHPALQKNTETPQETEFDFSEFFQTTEAEASDPVRSQAGAWERAIVRIPATSRFRDALNAYLRGDLKNAVYNSMESVVLAEYPQLAEYKQRLLDAGCIAAAMSGSGSTIFGICNAGDRPVIEGAFKDVQITTRATLSL